MRAANGPLRPPDTCAPGIVQGRAFLSRLAIRSECWSSATASSGSCSRVLGGGSYSSETRSTCRRAQPSCPTSASLALKARGFDSPYIKAFVVARINPLKGKDAPSDIDEVLEKMLEKGKSFDSSKIKEDEITAGSGGPPPSDEE